MIGLLAGGAALIANLSSGGSGTSRRDAITIVSLPPPPPPPPPPANTPPPPLEVQQRTEQPMIKEEQPHQAQPEPPKNEPPWARESRGMVRTALDWVGGLETAESGVRRATAANGAGMPAKCRARWSKRLQRNRKTRAARLNLTVKVWPDSNGRVARSQIADSTGDPSLDSAICNEVLNGLQLQPPPRECLRPLPSGWQRAVPDPTSS